MLFGKADQIVPFILPDYRVWNGLILFLTAPFLFSGDRKVKVIKCDLFLFKQSITDGINVIEDLFIGAVGTAVGQRISDLFPVVLIGQA